MIGIGRKAPRGYRFLPPGDRRGVASDDVAAWVADRLVKQTLSEWAAGIEDAKRLQGRGTVFVVPNPVRDDGTRWVVRHAQRGGAIARFLDDRYLRLGRPRPLAELLVSEAAREKGVRTPRIVAAAWYPDGAWYRADVVTQHVGDCRTLADRIFSPGGDRPATEVLGAAGRAIASLVDAGVHHVDVNAMNLLVPNDPEDTELWVLDLDAARPTGVPAGPSMLGRLARSLRRHEKSSSRILDKAEIVALKNGLRTGLK